MTGSCGSEPAGGEKGVAKRYIFGWGLLAVIAGAAVSLLMILFWLFYIYLNYLGIQLIYVFYKYTPPLSSISTAVVLVTIEVFITNLVSLPLSYA